MLKLALASARRVIILSIHNHFPLFIFSHFIILIFAFFHYFEILKFVVLIIQYNTYIIQWPHKKVLLQKLKRINVFERMNGNWVIYPSDFYVLRLWMFYCFELLCYYFFFDQLNFNSQLLWAESGLRILKRYQFETIFFILSSYYWVLSRNEKFYESLILW